MKPLVSIMIPTYNMPQIFAETMASAAAQTWSKLEIIVCDNSTNDDTEKLMKQYAHDKRVRYVRNKEAKTKAENFRPFENLAQGEYLQWLMHDDILLPDKVEKMARMLIKHPEVTLVTSQRGLIDGDGNILREHKMRVKLPITGKEYGLFAGEDVGRAMLYGANIVGEPSAALFRRKDLVNHYWNAEVRGYKVISDVVMWLELMEKGDLIVFKEPLSYYRRHSAQEGQRGDVLLLSRLEWFSLLTEYYERGVFLHSLADYAEHFKEFLAEEKGAFSTLKEQVPPKLWELYQTGLEQIKLLVTTKTVGRCPTPRQGATAPPAPR